ncbi:hybrid sensor histidine kinase/response regulator transcription factor [Spirosoma endophyticum]|uniref:histidine kinase n=1 Tax=Spirosoma endophyticum TaxID=662367 RepID=A0A1I2DRM0_9BACT|nr:hybrid sensor histidine kinase/response regulator transcription factor [Spirosoma endophyticum]SFE82963.1 ligand-binding sensor domain-containing protein [Spirosoma endophyticum]
MRYFLLAEALVIRMGLVISLILLAVVRAVSQAPAFEHLNTESGLLQNSVLAIAQDSRGFMWFGTRLGVSRYDGHQFRTYRYEPVDSSSLSGNYIISLLSDSQKDLWVGTQNGLNRYNPRTDAFERLLAHPNQPGALSQSQINCLYEDRKGTLWVGTSNGLNQLIDRRALRFRSYFTTPGVEQSNHNIRAVFEGAGGILWVGTADGLVRMTPKTGGYRVQTFRHGPAEPESISDNYVTAIAEDHQHNLWVGTLNGGLNRYNKTTNTFTRFVPGSPSGLIHNNIRQINVDKLGRLWIGTQEGLSLFNPKTETAASYRHDAANPKSLSRNSIYSIFEDSQGSIWIGTYYGGINVIYPHHTDFTVYRNSADRFSLSDDVISSIAEADPGPTAPGRTSAHNLWIGTEGGGLNLFDRKTGGFTVYKHNPANPASLGSNLVKVVYRDRHETIWVGTHGGGLNRLNPANSTFQHFLFKEGDAESLSAEVLALLETRDGKFWVGTNQGLQSFISTQSPVSASFVSAIQQRVGKNQVKTLLEDSKTNLWVGTNAGLYVDGPDAPAVARMQSPHLDATVINCLWEDRAGRVWIGTAQQGLSVYDTRTKTMETFTTVDGLPHNEVVGVLDGDNGSIWVSTANGLSQFDPKTRRFINYTTRDGLAGNDFNYNAACKSSSGELFFGGYQGITAFYPQQIGVSHQHSPVVVTALRLFNQPVAINGPDHLLNRDISLTRTITFRHDQNVFSLDFALLSYIKSGKNQYGYKLEGFDPDWTYKRSPSATYTNLPSGEYVFWIKGANNDGIWSKPTSLHIRVLPPFWKTWWAYALYTALVVGIIIFLIRFFVLRALLRRDHELNQLKLNFFTNISHEIRTHLTLISGPIERLMLARREDPLVQQQLGYIQKDAERLLRLVTELMDFRKAETNQLNLHVAEHDLVEFLNDIFLFFNEVAYAKHIMASFRHEMDTLTAWFDREQLEKVLFNLLSNAFKFTLDGGQISLMLEQQADKIYIRVIDNGRGIAPNHISKLFTNYYQVTDHGIQNTGYGIGLAFSKTIVELHKGTLTVESQIAPNAHQNRTCFTIMLRAGHKHLENYSKLTSRPAPNALEESFSSDFLPNSALLNDAKLEETDLLLSTAVMEQNALDGADIPNQSTGKTYTILLVEDNPAVRSFVSGSLAGRYTIIECVDGQAGWETAIEQIPDLIISDVTMPEMDGFTLCNQLKADERTSHIPVILLTAKTTTGDQVSGLALGADCYLTKPFSLQVLTLNIRNMLAAREIMRERFSRQITLQPQNIEVSSVDEQFLNKVKQSVETHLDNTGFDVDQLALEVGMSRSVLYKKLKALTDMSVNDFVKSFRLQKATQLLQQKKLSVNEVAYAVGFNDRKYFSKEFKKQFGKTPSEYAIDM